MSKLLSVGRSSPRQFVLVSLLMIIASSAFTNTLAALVLDQSIVLAACKPSSHLLKPAVIKSNSALSRAKSLATQFFKKELNREYKDAIESIHTFKNEWNVIKDIPKLPNKPTAAKVLNEMNEQSTLEKLNKDLILINRAAAERKGEAVEMKIPSDIAMFGDLEKESDEVLEAITDLLFPFKVKIPEVPKSKRPPLAADKTEHDMRNWVILHDYILLMEFTNDVAKQLLKKYCGLTI